MCRRPPDSTLVFLGVPGMDTISLLETPNSWNSQKTAPAEGAKLRSCLFPVRVSLWHSNIRGNWVEAPGEGEAGALNQSHMFPKMEAFQAAGALSAGGSGSPRATLQHSSPTHGRVPSTRIHLAQLIAASRGQLAR